MVEIGFHSAVEREKINCLQFIRVGKSKRWQRNVTERVKRGAGFCFLNRSDYVSRVSARRDDTVVENSMDFTAMLLSEINRNHWSEKCDGTCGQK